MIDFAIFGMSGRDKRVYEALLQGEAGSIRSIAEQTGINRGSVYESLKSLMRTGLVSYVGVGTSVRYKAEDPEKLHELITERRRSLLEAHAGVNEYIRGLEAVPGTRRTTFASFYEGDEGMANILRDVLTTCRLEAVREYCVVSSPRVSEYLYNNFRHYTRDRIKAGLAVRVLRHAGPPPLDVQLARSKRLRGDSRDPGSYMLIYGSKLAVISIDRYNHTTGIIISNAGVARTQQLLFEAAWAAA